MGGGREGIDLCNIGLGLGRDVASAKGKHRASEYRV